MSAQYGITAYFLDVANDVSAIEKFQMVTIFPDPASDYIQVSFANQGELAVSVFDQAGNLVLNFPHVTPGAPLNIQMLEPAVYFLELKNASSVTYTRLLKR